MHSTIHMHIKGIAIDYISDARAHTLATYVLACWLIQPFIYGCCLKTAKHN